MKALSAASTRIFLRLVEGLAGGEARRFDNAPGAFMAVAVDCLSVSSAGALYAIAHRYEQNGDLCPDPDVEFLVVDDPHQPGAKAVYPTAIDQPLGYRRYVEFDADGRPEGVRPAGQMSLASFCNGWFRNIRAQQGL